MDNKLSTDMVVVSKDRPQSNQTLNAISLFNQDGTPFSGNTPSSNNSVPLKIVGYWDAETTYQPGDVVSFSWLYGVFVAEAVETSTGEAPFTYVDGEEDLMSMFSDKWQVNGLQEDAHPLFLYQPGLTDPNLYGDTWRLYQGEGTATGGSVSFGLTPTYLGAPYAGDAVVITLPYNFTMDDVWEALHDLFDNPAPVDTFIDVHPVIVNNLQVVGAVDMRWKGYYASIYGAVYEVQSDDLTWDGTAGSPSAEQTEELFTGVGAAYGSVFLGNVPYVSSFVDFGSRALSWIPLIPGDIETALEPSTFSVVDDEVSFMFLVGYPRVPDTLSQGGSFLIQVALDNAFTMPIFAGSWPASSMSVADSKVPGPSLTQTLVMPAAIGQPVYMRVMAVDCYGRRSNWVNLTGTHDGQGAPIAVAAQPLNGNTHVNFDGTSYGGTATTLAEALAEIAAAAGITPP